MRAICKVEDKCEMSPDYSTHHNNSHARPTEPLKLLLEENYGEQAHKDHDGTFYQEDKKEKSLFATKLI